MVFEPIPIPGGNVYSILPRHLLFGCALLLIPLTAACGRPRQDARTVAPAEMGAEASAEVLPPGVTASRYRAVVVPEGLTWEEARRRAEADGGHLVTITSEEENQRVHALIADNSEIWVNVDVGRVADGSQERIQVTLGPWIGLYQPSGSSEPDGGWRWVTGEPVGYTNWSQANADDPEPNDLGGIEDSGLFFGPALDTRGSGWNDAPNDPRSAFPESDVQLTGEVPRPRGYVVEFEQ